MQSLCEALLYALRHIESRPSDDEDADVAILEEIAHVLGSASPEEIAVLRTVALKQGVLSLLVNLGLTDDSAIDL